MLTSLTKAELGERGPPVEIMNASPLTACVALRILSWGTVLTLGGLLLGSRLYRSLLKLLLLLLHHHRLLHVDFIGGGRCISLLLAHPSRLHLLVLAPDSLLDAVEDGLVMSLIQSAVFLPHIGQCALQLLLE